MVLVFDGASIGLKRKESSARGREKWKKWQKGFKELRKGKLKNCFRKLNKVVVINSEMIFAVCTRLKSELASDYRVHTLGTRETSGSPGPPQRVLVEKCCSHPKRRNSVQNLWRKPQENAGRKNLQRKKKGSLEIMTAPYEADPQLAYLSKTGYVDLVISNDSDLILFGAKRIFFKADEHLWGKLFRAEDLKRTVFFGSAESSFDRFLVVCILSGCDYFRFGQLKKFAKVSNEIERHSSLEVFLKRKFETWSEDKALQFIKAFLLYKYATVYDHRTQRCVSLNKFPFDGENEFRKRFYMETSSIGKIKAFDGIRVDLSFLILLSKAKTPKDFLGKQLSPKTLRKVVRGESHPYDLLPFSGKYLWRNQVSHVFYHLAFLNKRRSSNVLSYFYLRNNNLKVNRALSCRPRGGGADGFFKVPREAKGLCTREMRRPSSSRFHRKSRYVRRFRDLLDRVIKRK